MAADDAAVKERMNSPIESDNFSYRLDARDCVASVDSDWLDFNGKPSGRRPPISFWDYISGYEVRHLFKMMFDTARDKHREVSVPFRCDTPTARRFMELKIEPLDEGGLSITGELVHKETRDQVDLLADVERDPERFLEICSWCKRVVLGGDNWVEVEDAVRELGLMSDTSMPTLTHGICFDCMERVEDDVAHG